MSHKRKAPGRAGPGAKEKNGTNSPALIVIPGHWCNAFRGKDLAKTVPLAVKAATLAVIGRGCIVCGKPARFAGILEVPLPNDPLGKASVIIGMCRHCAPKGMREGRMDALEASPDDAEKILSAVLFALAPPASGAAQ